VTVTTDTTQATEAAPVHVAVTPRRPSLTGALLVVESLLLGGGRRTAQRNAWSSVVEDRQRARDRIEAQRVLDRAPALRS
jgi:hypothetical protein